MRGQILAKRKEKNKVQSHVGNIICIEDEKILNAYSIIQNKKLSSDEHRQEISSDMGD